VAAGDVDLAVVTGQETPRGLEDRHLFDQPFAVGGGRAADDEIVSR
jgi:DNA-binding transcriptional LysR family regulator